MKSIQDFWRAIAQAYREGLEKKEGVEPDSLYFKSCSETQSVQPVGYPAFAVTISWDSIDPAKEGI